MTSMTPGAPQPPAPGTGRDLTFNSPISPAVADRLVVSAGSSHTASILDLGCGWGDLVLRAARRSPQATALGVDRHEPDIARARAALASTEMSDRVRFVCGDAEAADTPADLTINVGAYHALGDPGRALQTLHERTLPGGRLIFGLEYWAQRPHTRELASMWPGASAQDCLMLEEIVDLVHRTNWRILDWHDSTRAELDAYEVGLRREREEWVAEYPDHPLRAEMDRSWTDWIRGHRRPLGFLTLVLARAAVEAVPES